MQSPLRLAGLPGDDRNRVRRRRPDDRLVEIVKQDEVLRPAPHERDRVAIDMADVGFGLLRLRQRDRRRRRAGARHDGARGVGRQTLLIHRIAVIGRDPGRGVDVQAVRHALMAVIDGYFVRRVDGNDLTGADDRLGHQEWLDGFDAEGRIEIALGETRGLVGGGEAPGGLEKAVRARVGAKVVIERLVLVKDHEDVLHFLTQKFDLLLKRPAIVPVSSRGRRSRPSLRQTPLHWMPWPRLQAQRRPLCDTFECAFG